MRKIKIYLDTSVISHLMAKDRPDRMAETTELWNLLKQGVYNVYISPTVLEEIEACPEPKKSFMLNQLSQLDITILEDSQEVQYLASAYIQHEVLSQSSLNDCLHIAYSVIENIDYIVSWNFTHLVNVRTINKVRIVNAIKHYREINIISPTMIIEKEIIL